MLQNSWYVPPPLHLISTPVMHPESTSVYPREAVAHVQPRDSDGLAVKHWGLEGFHNDGLTGTNTVIAIIDSGINSKHNAFKKEGKIHHASKNFLEDRLNVTSLMIMVMGLAVLVLLQGLR